MLSDTRAAIGGSRDDKLASAKPYAWRVFIVCWMVYTVFWTPYIVREHFPALTLLESGTLNVERYLAWTDDIFPGPHGGAYINNNPGASITGALPLIPLRPVLMRIDDWNQRRPRAIPNDQEGELLGRAMVEGKEYYLLLVAFLTVALVMAPATAGMAAYFCARLIQSGVPAASSTAAALLYSLATPVFYRAAHLNHNLLVADAGFMALLVLWVPAQRMEETVSGRRRGLPNLKPLSTERALAAGLLAGYALFCDYSGVVVAAVTILYVWLRTGDCPQTNRLRVVSASIAGVLVFVAALAAYQQWAFGSLFRPSQHFMTPTAPTSQGYRGFDWPSLSLVWANFFDPRFGLFAYCPALLLGLAAPFVKRGPYRLPVRESGVLLLYFSLFVLFCAANQYSWLQPLTGFRYLTPVVPAITILTLQVARTLPSSARRLIAVASLAQSFVMAAGHQNTLWGSARSLLERNFQLPWMVRLGHVGEPLSWWCPLFTFAALGAFVIWIWRGAEAARA